MLWWTPWSILATWSRRTRYRNSCGMLLRLRRRLRGTGPLRENPIANHRCPRCEPHPLEHGLRELDPALPGQPFHGLTRIARSFLYCHWRVGARPDTARPRAGFGPGRAPATHLGAGVWTGLPLSDPAAGARRPAG